MVNFSDKIRGKLSKLTITAYKDIALTQEVGSVEAMYNPEELTLEYGARYEQQDGLNYEAISNDFVAVAPGTLEVQLIFDSTLPTHSEPVDQQLSRLRTLCGVVDGTSRQTRYLKIRWGSFSWHGNGYFAGRMQRMSVRYNLFGRNGSPMRAYVTLGVLEDSDPKMHRAKLGLNKRPSPRVIVPEGTSLALVAAAQFAAVDGAMAEKPAVDYLALARKNNLDHLDDINPGKTLVWPTEPGAS